MSGEEITIDVSQLKKLKVTELRQHLTDFGLETKGNKAELLNRLESFLHEQEETELLEGEESEETAEGTGQDVSLPLVTQAENEKIEEGVEEEEEGVVSEADQSDPPVQEEAVPTKTKISLSGVSQEERVQVRAKRFGNTSEDAKKAARAARFGTSLENGYKGLGKHPTSAEDLEKMKKRGERFGSNVAPAMTKAEEDERKKRRIERFGTTVTELSMEERKKKRAARFNTS